MRLIAPPSLLAGILALTLANGMRLKAEPVENQQAHSFKKRITKSVSANYLVFLPKGYGQKKSKRWPLILFLHGAGERGSNLAKVKVHGPARIVKDKPDFPFIVVSPQCPNGQFWSNDVLLALLDEVTSRYKVDESRVYLTGMSMGGFGTWSLGLTYPDRFAAIAPICGGGDSIGLLLPVPKKEKALKSLPVWAFHGAKDNSVKLEESERMVNTLNKIGNDAKLTVYPQAEHDSWTETYDNPKLYEWFLQHQRPRK